MWSEKGAKPAAPASSYSRSGPEGQARRDNLKDRGEEAGKTLGCTGKAQATLAMGDSCFGQNKHPALQHHSCKASLTRSRQMSLQKSPESLLFQ